MCRSALVTGLCPGKNPSAFSEWHLAVSAPRCCRSAIFSCSLGHTTVRVPPERFLICIICMSISISERRRAKAAELRASGALFVLQRREKFHGCSDEYCSVPAPSTRLAAIHRAVRSQLRDCESRIITTSIMTVESGRSNRPKVPIFRPFCPSRRAGADALIPPWLEYQDYCVLLSC